MLRTGNALLLATVAMLTACSPDAPTDPSGTPRALASISDYEWALDEAVPLDANAGSTEGTSGEVSALNAASGGRAGGHADFVAGGVRSMYTFTSLSTVPPAAKGRFQLHRWFPNGSMLVMTGVVECMMIEPRPNGVLARMSGRVESLRVDNVDIFVPEHRDRTIWSVVDGGEGEDAPPDIASGLFNFQTAAQAAFHCSVGAIRFGFLSTRGNLQVKQD